MLIDDRQDRVEVRIFTLSDHAAVPPDGKLYIHGAGSTIDVHDASNFKYLRTITLDADMTTGLYVMPGR